MTPASSALTALAVQYWKLCAMLGRELEFFDDARVSAAEAQLRFARHKLDAILEGQGLRLTTYDGARWTSDVPASPVNAEDFGAAAEPIVEATLEPTIIGPDGIVHAGKVTLRKG